MKYFFHKANMLVTFSLNLVCLIAKPAVISTNVGEKLQLNDGAEKDDVRNFRSLIVDVIYPTHTRLGRTKHNDKLSNQRQIVRKKEEKTKP